MSSAIQADIEARLAEAEPDVEVLLAEIVGGRLVRLFIDHPDGVTVAAETGVVSIAYTDIHRSNLLGD